VRITGVGRDVVFVHQAGVERRHQRAAILDVELEQVGLAARQQMQGGGDDELVFGEFLGGMAEIDRDIAVVQRVVEELEMFALLEQVVGLRPQLQGPVVFLANDQGHLGDDPGILEQRAPATGPRRQSA
jgi:hypothetical protein